MHISYKRLSRLLVLLVLCVFLTACGEKDTVSKEDIRLTNTRLSVDKLSSEEREVMDQVENMLSDYVYNCHDNTLSGQNSSSRTLDLNLIVLCRDEDDSIVYQRLTYLQSFKPGDKFCMDQYLSGRYSTDNMYILAEYHYKGSYYRTSHIPLSTVSESASIQLSGGIPCVIEGISNYDVFAYTVRKLSVTPYTYAKDSYNLVLELEKKYGEPHRFETLSYRIVNAQGVVYDSSTASLCFIYEGEITKLYIDGLTLPPGSYTIEFY